MAKTAEIYTMIVRFSMVDEDAGQCDVSAEWARDHMLKVLEKRGANVDTFSLIAERKTL